MGIQRQRFSMDAAAAVVQTSFVGKPAEQGTVVQAFGMPLYTEHGSMVGGLDSLNHSVASHATDLHLRGSLTYGLVVERIDGNAFLSVNAMQEGVGGDAYRMGCLVTRSVLRMFDGCAFVLRPNVLPYASSQGDGQYLNAFADAQDRHLAVGSHAAEEQFTLVAFRVDGMELRNRLFVNEQRVDVGTAAQQQAVKRLEPCGERLEICLCRWQNHGNCTGVAHCLVITVVECAATVLIVASDTDERT